MSELPQPSDYEERQRFVSITDRSLSVYSPAGSGKTHAIVQRILAILHREDAPEVLKRLCVVTYTERAANEMRIRTRTAALNAGVSSRKILALDTVFFGTIHALCASLIRQYGYYLGIPGHLEVVENLNPLWRAFLNTPQAAKAMDEVKSSLEQLAHYISVFLVLEQASSGAVLDPVEPGEKPELNFAELLSFESKRSAANVEKGKEVIREWVKLSEGGKNFTPIPEWKLGGKEFIELWKKAFQPLKVWIARTATLAVHRIGCAFRDYRVSTGVVTFDDQIQLAASLMRNLESSERISRKNYRIILDEAQDTDPLQFEVLLGLAGGSFEHPPQEGRFSMVGDPQQSIYGDRADVVRYQELHGHFHNRGDGVIFDVTFRCSKAVIDFANNVFPFLLTGHDKQVLYVPLQAASSALKGNVCILRPDGIDSTSDTELKKTRDEAMWLAKCLASTGFEALGARSWEEVAILCPRNKWLSVIHTALGREGLRSQIHSVRDTYKNHPVYAWIAAILTVLCDPHNTFETVGVLREVFGIADEDLAVYCDGDSRAFYLDADSSRSGDIADALALLNSLRVEIQDIPLRKALEKIFEKVAFRDRVLSLPETTIDDVNRALRHLRAEASELEKSRFLLPEFTEHIQELLNHDVQTAPPHRDAIQVLNSKKAKGGEWDVVIVPYLWKKIRRRPEAASLSKKLIDDSDKESILLKEKQELMRLLYVTMTRPRHALFLIDDRESFYSESSKATTTSFAELLGGEALDKLPEWEFKTENREKVAISMTSADVLAPLISVNAETFNRACVVSQDIIQKILPHSLAHHGLSEDPELQTEEAPTLRSREGVGYGIWWHESMRWIPWSLDRTAWSLEFQNALAACPDQPRGEMEWRKFLLSPLADILSSQEVIIHTEIPFVWKHEVNSSIEGIMDMAIWHTRERYWTLLDWKTDRDTSAEALITRYQPQIVAYVNALKGCSGENVRSGLYSTNLAKWLPI
ncbi:MAG: UvrD-helicase domain-containing protein [Chthoniobacterales bacterium]